LPWPQTLIALRCVGAINTLKSRRLEIWIEGTPHTRIHNSVMNENLCAANG
jgi:hypothetical protein